ncbi:aminodeoxychorismate synthase component I [Leptolyngbya sp. 7M]|uniref:aminodeoxychorismate synthase component I n=1 Tax=Leptolyngbya sp. 7M TaxID=2812896 RepID=UPI001B8CE6D9|nr:aminodeoxychorismate synthase component I [Leptolyngbya sp. 7M]QYO65900.1 aminodeoxychorismate synthase component I [Leptolyngbya sp. 7M]
MIAGIEPIHRFEFSGERKDGLEQIERVMKGDRAVFFTLSYDFGQKLQSVKAAFDPVEPDIYVAEFDAVVVHDYDSRETFLTGNDRQFAHIEQILREKRFEPQEITAEPDLSSGFSRDEYITAVEAIREYIRNGYTYQTNLTQKLSVRFENEISPASVFHRLRQDHPAPFAALIQRQNSTVVSASPERFFRVAERTIRASPIKGTRPRGRNEQEDAFLREELLQSEKDRAENTMIVDLLRNDLGRVCEFASVKVEKLCDIEEHPTIFHLVSTISGHLRPDASISDILISLFPCGSITGAPKISTMKIIDQIEPSPRGLSMGTIGYRVPEVGFEGLIPGIDTSVAIRTMVIHGDRAEFNVGGGIVIDSEPSAEYEESLLKAKALLNALGGGEWSGRD